LIVRPMQAPDEWPHRAPAPPRRSARPVSAYRQLRLLPFLRVTDSAAPAPRRPTPRPSADRPARSPS
jgi:hypothetical protein